MCSAWAETRSRHLSWFCLTAQLKNCGGVSRREKQRRTGELEVVPVLDLVALRLANEQQHCVVVLGHAAVEEPVEAQRLGAHLQQRARAEARDGHALRQALQAQEVVPTRCKQPSSLDCIDTKVPVWSQQNEDWCNVLLCTLTASQTLEACGQRGRTDRLYSARQMLDRSVQRHHDATSTSTRSGIALKHDIAKVTCSAVSQRVLTAARHANTFSGHSSGTALRDC